MVSDEWEREEVLNRITPKGRNNTNGDSQVGVLFLKNQLLVNGQTFVVLKSNVRLTLVQRSFDDSQTFV